MLADMLAFVVKKGEGVTRPLCARCASEDHDSRENFMGPIVIEKRW